MTKSKKKCSSCNSKNLKVLYENLYDKDYFIEGKFSILKCENCGLEVINPLLNEKQLGKYYPAKDYYSYNKHSKLAILYHKISSYYYSRKNFFVNIILWPFSSLLYHYRFEPGKNLLEIGCGNGLQLAFYKKYGLNTNGLEPYGLTLTNEERKLGIERKSVINANFPKEKFDYIIMKEVLEHIPNSNEVLKKCYYWLKKGGRLIIVIPNEESLWQKIFKKNWYGYDVPRHVYVYNPKSIKILLEKRGFKINNIRKYDLPYMIDGSLKFYLVDKSEGKDKKQNIIFSSLSKILFAPISLIVTYLNLGAIFEVEAKK